MFEAKETIAWHFTDGWNLRDGQLLKIGKTYKHAGDLKLCYSGYHASPRLIDALKFAPGSVLSVVECGGNLVRDTDKIACTERRVLYAEDVNTSLHAFACEVALHGLCEFEVTDDRSYAAIDTKLAWLDGDASDKELAAARDAAGAAAWDAALAAARDAAEAARAAAGAAWAAAGAAAWDAARDAARADVRAAAGAAADAVLDAAGAAAEAAARDAAEAARAAAWDAAGADAVDDYNDGLIDFVLGRHPEFAKFW